MLTSVCLPCNLAENTAAPSTSINLTQEERKAREALVLDNAMTETNKYWDGQCFDGHRIQSLHHPCLAPSSPFHDCVKVHSLTSAGSKARLQEHPALLAEIQFVVKHVKRRPRELTLIKCTDQSCTFCKVHPVRAGHAMAEIHANRGVNLPPTPSANFPRHYKTYK